MSNKLTSRVDRGVDAIKSIEAKFGRDRSNLLVTEIITMMAQNPTVHKDLIRLIIGIKADKELK